MQAQHAIWILAHVLAAPLLIMLPANMPGKASEDGLMAWALVTHVGNLEEVPCSWLWPGLPLANAAIWGVMMKDALQLIFKQTNL